MTQRLATGEELPKIPLGNGGQNFAEYLRRKSIKNTWLSICAEVKAEGQKCKPYSFRHRYAYVTHTRPMEDGTMRAPKQIAEAMGHDLQTHLESYARFMIKDLKRLLT